MSVRKEWVFTRSTVNRRKVVVPTLAQYIPSGRQYIRSDLVDKETPSGIPSIHAPYIWVRMPADKAHTRKVVTKKRWYMGEAWVRYTRFDLVRDGDYREFPHEQEGVVYTGRVGEESLTVVADHDVYDHDMTWTDEQLAEQEKLYRGTYNTTWVQICKRNWRAHPTHARKAFLDRAEGTYL